MPASTYTIEATVRRAAGQTRKIEWEYSGKGSGTSCWNAWRKMRDSNATMDTCEPFISASLYRDGQPVERIGNVVSL